MRGHVALAAVTAFFPIGCGSPSLLAPDAGPVRDATTVDASPDVAFVDAGISADGAGPPDANAEQPDVGPPVPCEAGAPFIVVNYDGGSMVLRHGCGGSAPTLALSQCSCPEDCFPTASQICGTSDAGALDLTFSGNSGPARAVGVYSVGCFPGSSHDDSWTLGPTTSTLEGGQVRLKTFPAVGGIASGDFVATLPMQGGTISGTFCVLRAQ